MSPGSPGNKNGKKLNLSNSSTRGSPQSAKPGHSSGARPVSETEIANTQREFRNNPSSYSAAGGMKKTDATRKAALDAMMSLS